MDLAHQTNHAMVFRARSLGDKRLLGLPRKVGAVSDKKVTEVVELLAAVSKHDNVLHAKLRDARNDDDRTEIAKWDRTQRAAFSSIFRDALAAVTDERAATNTKREKLLSPPPLAPSDFVTALAENEMRAGMKALNDDQRARVMAEIGKGQHPALHLALARDPSPLSATGESARGLYRSFQQKAQAGALEALDQDDLGHEWAETSLVALANVVR